MNKLIKVFIVEDHAIFREGLKKILSAMPGIKIVGESENGAAFLKQLPKAEPDVVLLDIRMPVMDGIEAADKALKLKPGLKIIVLSMYGEEDYLYSMILETAIRAVAEGQQFFSPELNMALAKKVRQLTSNELPALTKKETEVLRFLCMGLTTHQIAAQLCISKRTVEGYRCKLLEKAGVSNTVNLVIFAIRNKLVSIEDLHSN
jgi:DNA-binding NarL/FixJ family response regulator